MMIMAIKSKEDVIRDIDSHFTDIEGDFKNCYIGVSGDVKNDLFSSHAVSENNGWWIYRTVESNRVAVEIKQHFIDTGFCGDIDDNSPNADVVYAFRMTPSTIPPIIP